jgi:hypothetical protein
MFFALVWYRDIFFGLLHHQKDQVWTLLFEVRQFVSLVKNLLGICDPSAEVPPVC